MERCETQFAGADMTVGKVGVAQAFPKGYLNGPRHPLDQDLKLETRDLAAYQNSLHAISQVNNSYRTTSFLLFLAGSHFPPYDSFSYC